MIGPSKARVTWLDSGREPKCAPNPRYPNGIDIDVDCAGMAAHACAVLLPYPAPRCGAHLVLCEICGFTAAITAAGRPDDPRSVILPCKLLGGDHGRTPPLLRPVLPPHDRGAR